MKAILLVSCIAALGLGSCQDREAVAKERSWEQQGDSIIAITFDTIRNSVMRVAGKEGFAAAIGYCNEQATRLTSTYASRRISIRRATDKYRNPDNRADSLEQKVLATFQQLMAEQKEWKPILEKDAAGNQHYFKPILMQAFCLNCHGSENDPVLPETWQAIRQKYPNDLATGYKEGDLRGIWHVTFEKK